MNAHYIKLLTLALVHPSLDVPLFVSMGPGGFTLVRTPTSLAQISHFDNEQVGDQLKQLVEAMLAGMDFLTVSNPRQGSTVIFNRPNMPYTFDSNNYVMQRFRLSPEQYQF